MSPAIITSGDILITAADSARVQRDQLLAQASAVMTVQDRIDADDATAVLRELSHFSKEIELARANAKAPALAIGKQIDKLAKELSDEINVEAARISRVLGAFEAEERRKADAARIAAENAAQDIARKAREEAAKAARSAPDAETADRKADAILAEAAEKQVTLRQAAANLAAPKAAGTQMREDVCFEVTDIRALYAEAPHLVNLEPNGTAIRAILRSNPTIKIAGLKHWREAKLNVR